MKIVTNLIRSSIGILVAIACIALWELATRAGTNPYFPPLHSIAQRFADVWIFERVPLDLLPSMRRMFAGYFIGVGLGIAIGVLLGSVTRLRAAADPVIDFMRSLPPTALIPFAIVVFGIGSSGKVVLIAFACLWPVLLNTMTSVANLDQIWKDSARAYKIRGIRYVRDVLIPAALPPVLAGARISLALALIMVVVTEMVGSTDGLGHFVVQTERTFAITDMWTGVILIGILGYCFNAAFGLLERLLLRGHGLVAQTQSQ